jgi:hypothetical protein
LIQGFLQTVLDWRVRIIAARGQVEASVPPRRPASGRIGAMEYRVYSLLEALHATWQDRENPPDQVRGLIQQSLEMGAIYDEQPEIGRRHDRRGSGLPIDKAHLAKKVTRL